MNELPRGLLRETLRRRMTPPPPSGCIDPETLSAWSEGTLHAREREAVETHASECARCQALLAAMARTAAPAAPSRWWRPSTFGWLAPLAAATAAILLWINVPRSTVVHQPAASPAVATAKPEPPASVPAPPPTVAPARTPPEIAQRRPAAPRRQQRANDAAASLPPVPPLPAAQPDTKEAHALVQAKGGMETAKDLAPAGKTLPAEATVVTGAAPAAAPNPFPDPSVAARFEGAGGGRGGRLMAIPPEVVSADANVRWRILPNGGVIRSTDRGATWQQQSTGVSVTLTAGAAPSRDVCWLVGPGGIVVLSTDGLTWQRVAFPEAIALVAVRATDASNATVTAVDGRTLSTNDGGRSWRQP
jgi:hypothetical protein